jgi:hypothetical protein
MCVDHAGEGRVPLTLLAVDYSSGVASCELTFTRSVGMLRRACISISWPLDYQEMRLMAAGSALKV